MNERLESLDVARGFDMFWIMGGGPLVVALCGLFGCGPESGLAAHMEHPNWVGLHFIDFVFPTFVFIAGISFPYSLASQRAKGRTTAQILLRILNRTLVLVALGLVYNEFLLKGPAHTVWGSVLARIGLAWGGAAALAVLLSLRSRIVLSLAILLGYWALSVFVTAPDKPGLDPLSMEGCFAGWVDRMLLPGELTHPGVLSSQGVLSTFPAVVTAMLGIFTGEYVRGSAASGGRKAGTMAVGAAALVAAGCFVAFGCGPYSFPIVKKLWSTSFTLIAAGYSLALFTLSYWLVDVTHVWKRTLFFRVIGMNAITIYLVQNFVGLRRATNVFFGWTASWFPPSGAAVILALGYVAVCWLLLYFLYRRKIFLKV